MKNSARLDRAYTTSGNIFFSFSAERSTVSSLKNPDSKHDVTVECSQKMRQKAKEAELPNRYCPCQLTTFACAQGSDGMDPMAGRANE